MDNMHGNKQDVRAALYCVVSHVILCQLLRLVPVNQKTNVIEAKCGWKILNSEAALHAVWHAVYFYIYILFPLFISFVPSLHS